MIPILRFPQFKDDWNEVKLGEVLGYESSSRSLNTIKNIGSYSIFGATGLIGYDDTYDHNKKYIAIIKDGAGVGRTFLCNPKTSIIGTLGALCIDEKHCIDYIYFVIKNIDFSKYVVGSTIPHLYFKDYSNEPISLPSLPEQEKIAGFLTAVDEKIANLKAQTQAVERYKKSLMQQMFI